VNTAEVDIPEVDTRRPPGRSRGALCEDDW
jgi:hypothetical protein